MQADTVQCSQQQKADHDVFTMCMTVLTAVHANQSLLYEMNSLTQSVAELMPLCEPSTEQPVGMRFEDVAEMSNKEVHGVETNTTRCAGRRKMCSTRRRNRQINAQRNKAPQKQMVEGSCPMLQVMTHQVLMHIAVPQVQTVDVPCPYAVVQAVKRYVEVPQRQEIERPNTALQVVTQEVVRQVLVHQVQHTDAPVPQHVQTMELKTPRTENPIQKSSGQQAEISRGDEIVEAPGPQQPSHAGPSCQTRLAKSESPRSKLSEQTTRITGGQVDMTASRGEATGAARREQLGAQDLQGLAMGVFASSALARRWTCAVRCTNTGKRAERLNQQEQAPPDMQTGQSIRACLRREVPTDHEAHRQSFNGSAPWRLKRKKAEPRQETQRGQLQERVSYALEC